MIFTLGFLTSLLRRLLPLAPSCLSLGLSTMSPCRGLSLTRALRTTVLYHTPWWLVSSSFLTLPDMTVFVGFCAPCSSFLRTERTWLPVHCWVLCLQGRLACGGSLSPELLQTLCHIPSPAPSPISQLDWQWETLHKETNFELCLGLNLPESLFIFKLACEEKAKSQGACCFPNTREPA